MSSGTVSILAIAMAASLLIFSLVIVLIEQVNHKLMRINSDRYLNELRTTRKVKAFEKLQSLCYTQGYRGPHLTDSTPEKIAQCIEVWMRLKGHYSTRSGNLVEAKIFDESIVFEVMSSTTQPASPGRHLLKSFADFVEFYQKHF